MKRRVDSLGDIVETVYIEVGNISIDSIERLINHVIDFNVDSRGGIRKGQGLVAYDDETEFNPEWVPRIRWGLNPNPWNAHSNYLEIELPNPADDMPLYTLVRTAMLAEIEKRLQVDLRKLSLD